MAKRKMKSLERLAKSGRFIVPTLYVKESGTAFGFDKKWSKYEDDIKKDKDGGL